jgi:hypothetical protein
VDRLKSYSGADSLLDKLSSASLEAPPAVAPVAEKVLEEAQAVAPVIEKVVEEAPTLPPILEKTVELTTSVPSGADILGGLPTDLPLPIIGGAIVAILGVALVVSGGGSKGDPTVEKAPPSVASPSVATTASSDSSSADVSVPYDAAAMLAYEKAGKPGDFASFKTKYLADTVAMVKSKQKK